VLLLALAGGPAGAGAAEEEDSEALKAAKGKVTFRVYCSNCHGAEAKGDGKLAPLLSVKPADLTRLVTKKDKGEFPAELVRQAIDGRAEVAGHGYREMPVWGDVFKPSNSEMSDPEKLDVAKRKIAELVAYLRTIQAPEK
jgi:mono/diheme cytochrome c family protein